ncbi:hypothetical protein DPMN_180517 [Dreissena polymorpha]|uniref:Uncharacterized protein n=1 Tax=Dreissena polymorpha TaxID=45954 RepID=A0A9D4EGS9_DREPO|nr:hypothetical protein DPMN_180517 [Dreissena polymorpha]
MVALVPITYVPRVATRDLNTASPDKGPRASYSFGNLRKRDGNYRMLTSDCSVW